MTRKATYRGCICLEREYFTHSTGNGSSELGSHSLFVDAEILAADTSIDRDYLMAERHSILFGSHEKFTFAFTIDLNGLYLTISSLH